MPWKRRGLLIQAVLRNSFACKAVFVPTHHANMQKEHSCCAAAEDKLGLYFKLGRQLAGTRQVRHGVCVFLDWKIFNWGIGLCNFFLEQNSLIQFFISQVNEIIFLSTKYDFMRHVCGEPCVFLSCIKCVNKYVLKKIILFQTDLRRTRGYNFFPLILLFFWLHSNTVVHSVQFFIGCNFLWLQMDESFPGDQNDTWIFFDPKPWRKSIPPNSSHLGKWGNILGDCTIAHWGNQFFSTFHPNGIQRKN